MTHYTFPGDLNVFTENFLQNGPEVFIDENGFVGINTESPVAQLDVVSSIDISKDSHDTVAMSLLVEGENPNKHWAECLGAYLTNQATVTGSGENHLYGLWGSVNNQGDCRYMVGLEGDVYQSAENTVEQAIGLVGFVGVFSGGAIKEATGMSSSLYTRGTITNAYGIKVSAGILDSGIIENSYGIYVGELAGNLKWGLYIDDPVENYFAGKVGVGINAPTAALDLNSDTLRLRTAKTPASASAPGNAGDICWDSDYLYICVATNTWKRTPLSSW
jgi:hypothetical protein